MQERRAWRLLGLAKKSSRILIVYAHPETPGWAPLTLKEVERQLKKQNQKCNVIDLYKIKYDPVLHEDEHYTAGERAISAQNKKFQQMIKDTDKLIFIHPVWWNGMPAILKGWMDRVLTARFAFKYRGIIPVKLLKGRKAVVFSTAGAPKILFWLFLRNGASLNIASDILGFCGIKTKVFLTGNVKGITEKTQQIIEKKVKKGLRWLL